MVGQRESKPSAVAGDLRTCVGSNVRYARHMDPAIVDNRAKNRFETETSKGTALLEYSRSGDRLVLVHTEVPKSARERGVGSRLVEAAFQQAREQGLRVVPVCPFVRAYLGRYPELRSLGEQK